MANDTTTTAPLNDHTEPNNSHQEESSNITINHHIWLAWTLTRLWDSRHLPAIKHIVDDHMNVDDNYAARGLLWSLTSKKRRDLQDGAFGHTIFPDHPSAPDYITTHLPTWLADFRHGPRGRQGPVLVQESESERCSRLHSIPSPVLEPRIPRASHGRRWWSLSDVESASNVSQTLRDRVNDGFRHQTDAFPGATAEPNGGVRQFPPMDRCPATVAAEIHYHDISPSPGNQFLHQFDRQCRQSTDAQTLADTQCRTFNQHSQLHVPTNFADSTLMDMEHPEIPPVLPTSDAPKQSPEVEPLTPPSRQDQRKFMKLLKKSPVLPEAIQPILSLYNFEILHNQQSPDVLDEVEKLLGYVNWPWWNYADRAYLINYKVTSILYRLLYLHGFAFHPYFLGFLMAPRLC